MFCEMCELREYYDAKKDYAIMKASEVLAGIDWNQYLFFSKSETIRIRGVFCRADQKGVDL